MKKSRKIYLMFILCFFLCVNIFASKTILHSGCELDYPPYCIVTKDGKADGFSVELLRYVAEKIGMDITFKVGPWAEIKQEGIDGKLDVLPLVGYSLDRVDVFNFSAPYLVLHGGIFVRSDNTSIRSDVDLKGKEVLVMEGDNAHEYVMREKLTDKIITTRTYSEAFKLLSEGKGDAVVVQKLVGLMIMKDLSLKNVKYTGYSKIGKEEIYKPLGRQLKGFEQSFCFATAKGSKGEDLIQKLNKGLLISFEDGTFDRLFDKWFPIEKHFDIATAIKYFLLILVIVIFLMTIIGFFILKKQVHIKTAELKKEQKNFKLFSEAVDYSINAMALTDLNGMLTYVNPSYEKMFGYPSNEAVGMAIAQFVEQTELGKITGEILPTVKEKGGYVGEIICQRKDKSVFTVSYSSSLIKDINVKPIAMMFSFIDITERKLSEKRLFLKDKVFDASLSAQSVSDAKGFLQEVNSSFLRIWGFSNKEDVIGKPISYFLKYEHDAETILTVLNKTGLWTGECTAKRGDGSTFNAYAFSSVILDDNDELFGYQSSVIDITDQKKAAKDLKNQETMYTTLFDVLNDAVVIINLDTGKFTNCNPKALKMYKIKDLDEFSKYTLWKLSPEKQPGGIDSSVLAKEYLEKAVKEGSYHFEWVHKTADAEKFYADIVLTPMKIGDSNLMQATVRDITERKKIENSLQESTDLLNESGRIAKFGGWEFDVQTMEQVWTQEVYRIHEVDMNYKPTVSKGLDFYAPASRQIIKEAVQRCIECAESFDLELEFITAKGNHRWVRSIGKAQKEHGKTKKIIGIFQDISEYKQSVMKLRRSEENLSSFMNSATEGFILTNSELDYILINDTALKVFPSGTKREDVIGKNILELVPELKETGRYDNYLNVIKTGEPFFSDDIVPNKVFGDIQLSLHAFKVNDGLGFAFTDITDRKKAIEEIKSLSRFPSENINPVLRVSNSGVLMYINESGHNIMGKDWNIEIGENIPEPFLKLLKKSYNAGRTVKGEFNIGSKIFLFAITPIKNTNYANIYGVDISIRKHSEMELKNTGIELENAHEHALYMLAVASEFKDPETGGHIKRIVQLTTDIARELGIKPKRAGRIGHDSILHDLGKLGISDYILLKPGKLSEIEYETMKQHTLIGAEIIGVDDWFIHARQIAMSHHEKWNGSGYPNGLQGEDIPIAARIVAIADEFDALMSRRPYKEAWSLKKAVDTIKKESGTHFDPRVVEAFLSLHKKGMLKNYSYGI